MDNAPPDEQGEKQVTLAAIIGAHGVNGEVRLKLFGEGVDSLRAYTFFHAAGRTLTLKAVRPGPNGAVARFVEVNDRTAAEALRGVELTIPRSALPPLADGEYYHVDLIGIPCVSDDGRVLGHICAVENFGAGDIVEVEQVAEEGRKPRRFMVPMHAVTIEEGRAIIAAAFVE